MGGVSHLQRSELYPTRFLGRCPRLEYRRAFGAKRIRPPTQGFWAGIPLGFTIAYPPLPLFCSIHQNQ